jgi:Flp pilus assembly pilin Flp
MRNLFQRLWNDDGGFIVSLELMIIVVILLLGIIAGLSNLRSAVVTELTETARAVLALNQSYTIHSYSGCTGSSGASNATDTPGSVSVVTGVAPVNNIDFTICP